MGDIVQGGGKKGAYKSQIGWVHETGQAGIAMVWRIGVLGPEFFPTVVTSNGINISNQVEMIKPGFWGGETLGDKRDLRDGEGLRGEVNNRVGQKC